MESVKNIDHTLKNNKIFSALKIYYTHYDWILFSRISLWYLHEYIRI